MTAGKKIFVGEITQLAGACAVLVGLVLTLHHWGAAAALLGGIAAYFVGKKLRGV
jgi:hypothetical protein